jgi:hypothetical protein
MAVALVTQAGEPQPQTVTDGFTPACGPANGWSLHRDTVYGRLTAPELRALRRHAVRHLKPGSRPPPAPGRPAARGCSCKGTRPA